MKIYTYRERLHKETAAIGKTSTELKKIIIIIEVMIIRFKEIFKVKDDFP